MKRLLIASLIIALSFGVFLYVPGETWADGDVNITSFMVEPNPAFEGSSVYLDVEVNGGGQPLGGEFYKYEFWKDCRQQRTDFCGAPDSFQDPNYGACGIDPSGQPREGCATGGPKTARASFRYDDPGTFYPAVRVTYMGELSGYGNSQDSVKVLTINPFTAEMDVTPEAPTGPNGPATRVVGEAGTYSATWTYAPVPAASSKWWMWITNKSTGSAVYDSTQRNLAGDGGPENHQITHTFTAAGTYEVCAWGSVTETLAFNDNSPLIGFFIQTVRAVGESASASDTECKDITVTSTSVPTVDLKANGKLPGQGGSITVTSGSPAQLTWTSSNASSCVGTSAPTKSGWNGNGKIPNNTTGESTGPLTVTTQYTLTCTGSGGQQASDTVTIAVQSAQCGDGSDNDGDGKTDYPNDPGCTGNTDPDETDPSAPQVTFTVNGQYPQYFGSPGDPLALNWSATNATSCSTDGGSWNAIDSTLSANGTQIGTSGNRNGTLDASAMWWQIRCTNGAQSTTKRVDAYPNQEPSGGIRVDIKANGSDGPLYPSFSTSVTLSWTTSGTPTSCSASGSWSGSKDPTGGSQNMGTLSQNSGFQITCSDAAGNNDTDTVYVYPGGSPDESAVTTDLTANGELVGLGGTIAVPAGSTVTLAWQQLAETPDACTASGAWSGGKPISGSQDVTVASDGTYQIECPHAASGTQGYDYVNIKAQAPPGEPDVDLAVKDPVSEEFVDGPVTVGYDGTAHLQWTSSAVDECRAFGGWGGDKDLNDAETRSNLTSDQTYTIECRDWNLNPFNYCGPIPPFGTSSWNDDDCTYVEDTVQVNVAPEASVALTANPAAVDPGGSSTLTWETAGVDSCTASNDQGNGQWDAATVISPIDSGTATILNIQQTTTFSLSCTPIGGGDPVADEAPVTVNTTEGPSDLNVTEANACSGGWTQPAFSWTFPNQAGRHIQMDESASFASPVVDLEQENQHATSYVPVSNTLDPGTLYYWRVRGRTAGSGWSSWSTGPTITTHPHRGPSTTSGYWFVWSPENGVIDEPVNIHETATFYGGLGPDGANWS